MIYPKRIRIVSPVYPRPYKPESGRFVANLAEGWSAQGVAVDVISATTLSERLKGRSLRENVSIPGVNTDLVPTLGTPFAKHLPKGLYRLLLDRHNDNILSGLRGGKRPDLIYAQFAESGQFARVVAREKGLPYFVALGESHSLLKGTTDTLEMRRTVMRDAAGIVCVSPRLQDEAIELGADSSRVELILNFPNWARFRPMDKVECRQKLGLSQDAFIPVYVGHYYERKGASRLNAALHKMTKPVQAAFLGSGPLVPDFPGVIKTGSVSHEDLALWLNAADVLALPTLAEGCCNAIAEAIACALPAVTSDIPDVRWQVPDKGVVLVNPYDIDALAAALDELAANPLRVAEMRESLLPLSQADREKSRPSEILSWIQRTLANDRIQCPA
ncbi:glycosyltransferase [Ruegeria arenilitoris]|uniref:glycosyltransferase n=1 Tax=Ruegeria arenilitoris TaxID=1173585 RepID=UPI00147BBAD4|nr:glycosyltransferase [Ruegeria arenilitoris]